jgi:hypothetical protein
MLTTGPRTGYRLEVTCTLFGTEAKASACFACQVRGEIERQNDVEQPARGMRWAGAMQTAAVSLPAPASRTCNDDEAISKGRPRLESVKRKDLAEACNTFQRLELTG